MTPSTTTHGGGAGIVRRRIEVRGVVQGVGFRPFVHRMAVDRGLAGWVGNDTRGVFVEVEGPAGVVALFERDLVGAAPPLARIDAVDASSVVPVGRPGFAIVASRSADEVSGVSGVSGLGIDTFVAPDAAVCDDCVRELFDPADPRYRYPFVTCTNCGPRFTITRRLPYDRAHTTMAGFALCAPCAAQYDDPADRRFHAQPLACADCGPRLAFSPAGPGSASDPGLDPVAATQAALAAGSIVAVKGLGGYHLACDPRSDAAVALLRRRKGRADKPFALLVRDLATARRLAVVDEAEAVLLAQSSRPIVLLVRRSDDGLSALVAPDNPLIGLMLPSTPLHHLLLQPVPGPDGPVPDALVMTSGNVSDEPLAYDDEDARRRLAGIADAWLTHDRPIHVPCDDSVVRVVDGEELPLRRSRGYAPLPLTLPLDAPPLLAVGGELKTTFCLATGRRAWMSQHIGDMGSVETLAALERSADQFRTMYAVEPAQLVADLHPGYHTRQWAEGQASLPPPVLVQHHHAHVAALMAEHGVTADERIVGVAFDGTGYGTDGAIWGGEVLLAGYDGFSRCAHLGYVPLPGGDATIRKPYRAALAHLWAAGIDWSDDLPPVRAARPGELDVLRRQLERDVACVPTSSMGRLFDAVASLLDVRHEVTYEAQGALQLEALASAAAAAGAADPGYAFAVEDEVFSPAPVLTALLADLRSGTVAGGEIAAGFHRAVARLVADVASAAAATHGV
ncbi:MAG TPA: carbamoyltransferase HypF, partial [Acidimicrobiales bacterium]|nr:carbamoyltransferase HypF [Acidimicrobiales bacterium]